MKTTLNPNSSTAQQTTLYYREGSSDKVYHVSLEADQASPDRFLVHFAYGRRGATLQTGTKTAAPVDYPTALRTYNQLVAAKLAKGYSPGADGTPYQHTEHEGRATGLLPQLLTPVADEHALGHLLLDPLFCLQEKLDGRRLLLRKQGDTVEASNRQGLLVAVPAPIVAQARQIVGDCLLDGEAIGETFHVFDLLESADGDLRAFPYVERLQRLDALLLSSSPSSSSGTGTALRLVATAFSAREKIARLERLRRERREGVVLKNLTAPYTPGRASCLQADQWKHKFVKSASFVVTRVHPSKRSVALGLYAGGEILDAGNVTIPANHVLPPAGAVVEVRYLYAFKESGAIYQPVYLGEREDIAPAECTVNQLKYRHEPSETATRTQAVAPAPSAAVTIRV